MKRRGKSSFPSKYVLLLLTVICIMLLFAGYATGYAGEPIRTICNYVFVPMQKGLDYVGESISINSDDTKTKEQLIAENEQLQEQIDELSTQLTNTRLQQPNWILCGSYMIWIRLMQTTRRPGHT